MKTNEFIEELKETLELEDVEINENTNLKDLEEYDSLSVLAIIAMIDENFGKKLSGQDFQSITTVKSLMELIGKDCFE
jgi:acyl carrier protein